MRNAFLIAWLSLFQVGVGRSQTTVDSLNPPAHMTESRACATCSASEDPVPSVVQSNGAATVVDALQPPKTDLPDAPSPQPPTPPVPFEWRLDHPKKLLTAAPRYPPIWDKKMWAAHIVYAGAIVFDAEVTHAGLANHRCAEGNVDLGTDPSRKDLYMENFLTEFAPETLLDWLGAFAARGTHTPRWFWKQAGYVGATGGTIAHLHGGIEWFTHGCM